MPEDAEKQKFAIKLQFQINWSFNWDKKRCLLQLLIKNISVKKLKKNKC